MSDVLQEIRDVAPGEATPMQVRKLARRLDQEGALELPPRRLWMLSSFTTDFLDTYLRVEGARHGMALSVRRGGFGEFETALMGAPPEDDVDEVLLIQMRPEDLDRDAVQRFYASGGQALRTRTGEILDRLAACIDLYRKRSDGPVLVANFAPPHPAPLAVFDATSPSSLTHVLAEMNLELARRFERTPGVYVWDYAGLVAARGAQDWTDPRLWALARTAVAARHQPHLAAHLVRTVRGVLQPAAKCLVLDLDQTLWGGAVGDLGVEGIELSDDFPGSAFKEFQRAVLGLRDRGIVLAIASKNDEDVVREAMGKHPEMLVSMDDFAAHRIHWGPKSQSCKELAEQLNIGLDALVFFDDNPVERQEVRVNAPGVRVVDVPEDPVRYVSALGALADFDVPGLTGEDLGRAASYQAQQQRETMRAEAGSMEDFLTSLEMTAEVGELDAGTTARIAQLVGKTNQYNLTTRRHSQAELEAFHGRDDGTVCWLRLKDRFGDMGLIAIGVLLGSDEGAVIDSLIMSCRAANRDVEQAMVAVLCDTAQKQGHETLIGEFIPSPRNHVVAELYTKLGFEDASDHGDTRRHKLSLKDAAVSWPTTIRRG